MSNMSCAVSSAGTSLPSGPDDTVAGLFGPVRVPPAPWRLNELVEGGVSGGGGFRRRR